MNPMGRDQALRRLSRITRWSVGGAVALAGVFSAVVAHSRPGHAKAASVTVTSPSTSTGNTFLQPPSQAPSAATGRGLVTSGAS